MFYPAILFLLAVGIVGALLVYVKPDIVHVREHRAGSAVAYPRHRLSAFVRDTRVSRRVGWLLFVVAGCRSNPISDWSGIVGSSKCRWFGASRGRTTRVDMRAR
jgi:hypothetical protein